MASYEEIKAKAMRLHHDRASPEGTKKLAEIAIALCDRLAELGSKTGSRTCVVNVRVAAGRHESAATRSAANDREQLLLAAAENK